MLRTRNCTRWRLVKSDQDFLGLVKSDRTPWQVRLFRDAYSKLHTQSRFSIVVTAASLENIRLCCSTSSSFYFGLIFLKELIIHSEKVTFLEEERQAFKLCSSYTIYVSLCHASWRKSSQKSRILHSEFSHGVYFEYRICRCFWSYRILCFESSCFSRSSIKYWVSA